MMQKIQKFGGAMFTPVLLFAFAGVSCRYRNPVYNRSNHGKPGSADKHVVQMLECVPSGWMDRL